MLQPSGLGAGAGSAWNEEIAVVADQYLPRCPTGRGRAGLTPRPAGISRRPAPTPRCWRLRGPFRAQPEAGQLVGHVDGLGAGVIGAVVIHLNTLYHSDSHQVSPVIAPPAVAPAPSVRRGCGGRCPCPVTRVEANAALSMPGPTAPSYQATQGLFRGLVHSGPCGLRAIPWRSTPQQCIPRLRRR